MEQPRFSIRTTMEKSDYRNFLYLATFVRHKMMLPFIAVMALIGSIVARRPAPFSHLPALAATWLFLFMLATAVVCLRIERLNNRQIAAIKAGSVQNTNLLHFYDEKVDITQPETHGITTMDYNQFYELLETRRYFIFYLNNRQALPLRKKDIADPAEFAQFIRTELTGKYKQFLI